VNRVRGLVLKREYQEYTFNTTQSLKNQLLEYEFKYERVKEKKVEIIDKEKKNYLFISLFKVFIYILAIISIYNPN
jgi:hypothetical protein